MQICNTSEKIRLVIHHLMKLETPESLQDGSKGTIRHLKCLDDLGNGSIVKEVLPSWVLYRQIVLRNGADERIVLFRIFYQADGFISSDCNREYGSREQYCVSQRKDWQ